MSAIKVETTTIVTEKIYITLKGSEKPIRVLNPDGIPDIKTVLEQQYPVVLCAGWNHNIEKVYTNAAITDFHVSWLEPSDKGGLSLFCVLGIKPTYGLVCYTKGDKETNGPVIEIRKVTSANCFPWK